MQFIITKCNTARLIDLLQDYLIVFMQLFVQFVKLFRVLRKPEDFSTKWPPKRSRDLVAMVTSLKNIATYATNHMPKFQRLPSHILGDIKKSEFKQIQSVSLALTTLSKPEVIALNYYILHRDR